MLRYGTILGYKEYILQLIFEAASYSVLHFYQTYFQTYENPLFPTYCCIRYFFRQLY